MLCQPRTLPLLVGLALHVPTLAQTAHMNEAAAKEAVYRIVRHSGLLANFVVREDDKLSTAVAYIKGNERVIAYNPAFLSAMLDSAHTDWSAVSVLAHEIGHHLLGHTLDPEGVHPGDELACDRYSGFILQRMGVTLADALVAIEVAGDVHGTLRHPPRQARISAIRQGWEDAERISQGVAEEPYVVERTFRYVVHLVGDANTYFVDAEGCLVWFNDHAEPIEFGSCTRLAESEFVHELTWQDHSFVVDGRNTIWRRTAHGMPMQVGRMEPFARP
ncbi:MAG: hypothetical protein JNL43_13295 [Flavobacteriales bacterium]|nr:hypothetical protein [Flavobacteriales bacterium]HRH70225.1 hypothetical protein [Flavobacteriales bacterium]